jgi:hypothetical protein
MTDQQQQQNTGTDHSETAGTGSGSSTGTGKANGKGNGHSSPFDDFDNPFAEDNDADDWRSDLPTEAEVKAKPTSVYRPQKLRALVRLRDTDLEEYFDLTKRLISAAGDPSVTRTKLDRYVQTEAGKMQREAREAATEKDENGQQGGLVRKVLDWLETTVISRLFVDEYRRPFMDYRDPATNVFTCRPVGHPDVVDIIVTNPVLKIAPPKEVISAVIRTLEGKARRSGNRCQVFVRRGWHEERVLYIDRVASDSSVIQVDASGLRMITLDACPVRFQHDLGMGELPVPVKGSSLDRLWDFIRAPHEQDRKLILGFLIGFYMPNGPYSGLAVYGEYGAAKTVAMEMISRLLDPNLTSPGGMSQSEQDTMIHAQRVALLRYDDLAELSEAQSKLLGRLVQGNSFRTRLLYTNNEEAIFQAELPAIVNGNNQFITQPELADRFATITLKRIPASERKERQELRDSFNAVRPELLGVLLSAVSAGLARTNFAPPKEPHRCANHVIWVSRCEHALGMADGDYARAFDASAKSGAANVVESSLLASAIVHMQELSGGQEWRNTPDATLDKLNAQATDKVRRNREWPPNSVWLTRRLRPLVPTLGALGIDVVLDAQLPNKSRAIIVRGCATSIDPDQAQQSGPTPNGPDMDQDLGPRGPEPTPESPELDEDLGLEEAPPKAGERPAARVRRSF